MEPPACPTPFPSLTVELVAIVAGHLEGSYNGCIISPSGVWLAMGQLGAVDRTWRDGVNVLQVNHVRALRAHQFSTHKATNSAETPDSTGAPRPLPLPLGPFPNASVFLLDTAESMLAQDPEQSLIAWLLRMLPSHPRTPALQSQWVSPDRAANRLMRFMPEAMIQHLAAVLGNAEPEEID